MDNLEMKLLAGLPIVFEHIGKVYPLKLREIAEIGETEYNQYISVLCFDMSDLIADKKEINIDDITVFDVIIANCIRTNEYRDLILMALTLFFKEEVKFNKEYAIFYLGEICEQRIIYRDNYDKLKEIITLQNVINKNKKDEYNPANQRAKEIAENLKKAKEKINKSKSKNGENLTLCDIISAFSAYNKSIDITRVWDMTMYQFNNQFQRIQLINDYEINIQSLLAGADPNKVQIKHFISKLE